MNVSHGDRPLQTVMQGANSFVKIQTLQRIFPCLYKEHLEEWKIGFLNDYPISHNAFAELNIILVNI